MRSIILLLIAIALTFINLAMANTKDEILFSIFMLSAITFVFSAISMYRDSKQKYYMNYSKKEKDEYGYTRNE